MELEKLCEKGAINMNEFFEFIAGRRVYRTHLLDRGDYVVIPHSAREDILVLEKIAELDSPEKGDFATIDGTTGPINANVFIRIGKEGFSEHLLIEGDKMNERHCSVYNLVNKYLDKMRLKAELPINNLKEESLIYF